ncbi:type IV pilus secretin PilQ [Herbaspirillum sp. AP02]|uniref:type IV pilus secretin PilQ n=1 Tax=unclassified Herbaspirillum TaxID=2624150 RepID=UPI0015DA773E|nr:MULTISPECIES: type IV pilus secretin PilQ [unclassified Herbaspirillum]MBG7620798.1 type IV pilus secretin PilQ [Herbaspirillum sp. AP02]NZD68261.1 type IV pilus secretin PilQ [Herbaspirillum sp. AP21]
MRALLLLFASLLSLSPRPCLAENRLHGISIQYRPQGATLTLQLAHPMHPAQVGTFQLLDPAQLVLDLPQTTPADKLPRTLAASGVLKRVLVAADDERLRLQLQLKHAVSHRLRIEDERLLVELDQRAGPEPGALQAIDFRRGAAGEGQLRLELGAADQPLQVRQLGRRLVVDIGGASLSPALQRPVEVGRFATPVTHYHAYPYEGGTRVALETQGQWRYQAYQSGRRLVIDVLPVSGSSTTHATHAASGTQSDKRQGGDRLSLNFQNIDIRTALQVLADYSDVNLVASDAVAGQLSLRLRDVPWDQALELILQAGRLEMRRTGEVLWIAPREEMQARERQELEQKALIADLEPVHAESFQLNYQRADTLRRALGIGEDGNTQAGRRNTLLSRRGSAMIDHHTNQLLVTDTLAVLANVRKLIERIDVAARQVLIEARIVEADDSFARNLGVKLGLAATTRGAAVGNGYAAIGEKTGQTAPAPGLYLSEPALNLRAEPLSGAAPGSFGFTLFNAAAQRFLNVELSALEADGRGKIVSSPRLITADQQAALIEQGEEIPYQQAAGNGTTATAFKKANLKLEVTPQITPDGNVILDVDLNKDSRGNVTPGGLAINTKHVKTKVQVEDGGTVVIGGIYTQTDNDHETRVPLLGDIPILGALFRSSSRVRDKTELLIFLTPRIVAPPRPY